MRPTRSSANSSTPHESGFTIVELLVAMVLCAIIGTLVSKVLVLYSDTYRTDAMRLRIQQNLRGALDIISMNVRQAGEGLDQYFPALTLAAGISPGSSVLTVRRKIVTEVLVPCFDIVEDSDQITVSDAASATPQCLPANLTATLTVWRDARLAAEDETLRIYIYDRVAKVGEFLDYDQETVDGSGNTILSVDGPSRDYPMASTSLYILEEYSFSFNEPTTTLQLFVDGHDDAPQDVAYRVTQFQAEIRMQDDTVVSTLQPDDAQTWKDIRAVNISLAGEESWRTATLERTVRGEYFPRNVLSK